jgi:hypothetical protein
VRVVWHSLINFFPKTVGERGGRKCFRTFFHKLAINVSSFVNFFRNSRKFSKIFAITITFYSEPLKYFSSLTTKIICRLIRKQFAESVMNGGCYIPPPHTQPPSSYAPGFTKHIPNFKTIIEVWLYI